MEIPQTDMNKGMREASPGYDGTLTTGNERLLILHPLWKTTTNDNERDTNYI